MMEGLIESFSESKPQIGKAFVRGGTEGGVSTSNNNQGSVYQPKPLYPLSDPPKEKPAPRKPFLSSSSSSEPQKRKRAIDELKEELARYISFIFPPSFPPHL